MHRLRFAAGQIGLQVVFGSDGQQSAVLQVARHHNLPEHPGVIVHEDRTKAQQLQYRQLAAQARAANLNLEEDKLLGPFRWVIRTDKLRLINADASRIARQSVYCKQEQLALAQAIARGRISNRRAQDGRKSSRAPSHSQHDSYHDLSMPPLEQPNADNEDVEMEDDGDINGSFRLNSVPRTLAHESSQRNALANITPRQVVDLFHKKGKAAQ